MAKISKSVREKRKDFSKTKLKVGKSKQLPTNHTDTSFRSKAVVLPKQSVTRDPGLKDSESLQHYLALLSHKSGEIRKDALQQLTSYLNTTPPTISTTVTPLLKVISPLVIDDTSSVRRLLLELFNSVLIRLPQQVLKSHRNLLLLYISSAMTHISPSIRADSTRFLAWTMAHAETTDLIINTQLTKFLDTFATLFGWTSQGASSVSNVALLSHLNVFNSLLHGALNQVSHEINESVTITVPISSNQEIFIAHQTTLALLKPCESLNLFAPESAQADADLSNYHIVEPHLVHLVTYLANRFTDSVNGDRSLCIPILELFVTLTKSVDVQNHIAKELKSVLRKVQNGIETIQESDNSRTFGQASLLALWRSIQDNME